MIGISLESSYYLKDDSVIIISLYNNIYDEHLPQIKDLFSEFITKDINNIILDLSDCLFIEKEIWEYLVELKKELLHKKGDLVLINMYGVVKNDYNIMELSNYLESFNDINNAFYNFGILNDIKSA
ncbi:STAS domain-containing protein [Brachyspira hyodysenteriae]|uniref:STAS domain-containing protein n=1 Tax=Brachyspira hyodysenteriae TaxID=159 RepID=UPI0022CD8369|nr:STAS domain-containing protein [Brachyspira hyodysenteriae]MCZ9891564.1 STAS domain-containing protein [Brachyspira hyodysenteriae]MCZ9989112.1 STAS domain-containing protein [Brachyspira hyodysenteriae]MCZ9997474.1 STAS domain-containing protein [Brachyspira hyodysenteriae]MDA0000916.1 STAS domain-containing protein [Brachyspira hyodysenteriae]MDA0005923.1 STAS domain-containing protein [Brachyspira hyodysenteriae]